MVCFAQTEVRQAKQYAISETHFSVARNDNPPGPSGSRGLSIGEAWQCPTFTGNITNYHRPKSVSLSCSEWEGVVPLRYGRQAKGFVRRVLRTGQTNLLENKASCCGFVSHTSAFSFPHCLVSLSRQHGYRIKPHKQLVPVS